MKRILPLIVTALALLSTRASAAPETPARIVSVDYVLALMDAGIDQKEIVRRIVEKNLTFRVAPGDMDRLSEAGAGKALIDAVTAEQVTSQWERPNRFGTGAGVTDGEGYDAAPSYGGYAPGYSSFTYSYGYPYYYYPYYPYSYYYAPYGHHTYYSTPYYQYPRYSYRTAPRGSASFRGAPRGSSVRSTPHTGGSPRSSPRGTHH